jgi:hypothetical protein
MSDLLGSLAAPADQDLEIIMGSLVEEKAVRIMCDYSAEGVWQVDGGACSVADLPVTAVLQQRILNWQAWFETCNACEDVDPNFDHEGFTIEGLSIATAVKAQLPDWKVLYYDEEAWNLKWQQNLRVQCTYEIMAKLH